MMQHRCSRTVSETATMYERMDASENERFGSQSLAIHLVSSTKVENNAEGIGDEGKGLSPSPSSPSPQEVSRRHSSLSKKRDEDDGQGLPDTVHGPSLGFTVPRMQKVSSRQSSPLPETVKDVCVGSTLELGHPVTCKEGGVNDWGIMSEKADLSLLQSLPTSTVQGASSMHSSPTTLTDLAGKSTSNEARQQYERAVKELMAQYPMAVQSDEEVARPDSEAQDDPLAVHVGDRVQVHLEGAVYHQCRGVVDDESSDSTGKQMFGVRMEDQKRRCFPRVRLLKLQLVENQWRPELSPAQLQMYKHTDVAQQQLVRQQLDVALAASQATADALHQDVQTAFGRFDEKSAEMEQLQSIVASLKSQCMQLSSKVSRLEDDRAAPSTPPKCLNPNSRSYTARESSDPLHKMSGGLKLSELV